MIISWNLKFKPFLFSNLYRSEKPILEFFYDEIARVNFTKLLNISDTPDRVYHPEKIYGRFPSMENMSTRVIVHGFGSSCHHVWIYEMRTALMVREFKNSY